MLRKENVKEIIVIPVDFSRSLTVHGQGDFGIIIDASNANTANIPTRFPASFVRPSRREGATVGEEQECLCHGGGHLSHYLVT